MTTSKRISLIFAWYVTTVVMVFGLVVNIAFFVSRYGLVAQQPILPPKKQAILDQKASNPSRQMQELKRANRVTRRPLMGMGEPMIVTDVEFLAQLNHSDNMLRLVELEEKIWHYRMLPDRAILTLVDPLVDSQLMLIYITLSVALLLALISYRVSMIIVRRGLAPLYQLADHIHHTQDPEQYEHLVVWPDQDELQQVSSALTHAMDTIASQTHNLKQFVTHASHELKTPLMMISSSIDLMAKSGITTTQTQTIKQTTSSMKSLIDRLMATMRDDVLQTQELDMAMLIRDVVDRVSTSHHHSHELDLSITEHLSKHADPMICESIITNLVDNAHKYAVAGTTIEIIANTKQFIISNRIDPAFSIDLEQIWQPFYQWDESQTDTNSHGLGLSIVKQYVERAEWKIGVEVRDDRIEFSIDWAEKA